MRVLQVNGLATSKSGEELEAEIAKTYEHMTNISLDHR